MKKYIGILLVFLFLGCLQIRKENKLSNKQKEELKIETKNLMKLHDSINTTGDIKYYHKYMKKLNEMIKKYPDDNNLLMVKKQMEEIFK